MTGSRFQLLLALFAMTLGGSVRAFGSRVLLQGSGVPIPCITTGSTATSIVLLCFILLAARVSIQWVHHIDSATADSISRII